MTREDVEFFERLFRSLDAVNARLDQANARLERIGGLVNGGARGARQVARRAAPASSKTLEDRVRELERKKAE